MASRFIQPAGKRVVSNKIPVIEIDPNSGFCFGVTASINKAETELKQPGALYALGDLVHNSAETERLQQSGLKVVSHAEMKQLGGSRLLLRAHGEPPSTYKRAEEYGIEIIDATCPVVLKLQQRIAASYNSSSPDTQIVIYGKAGHAEVNGLVGQTDGTAIVVDDADTLENIDFSRPVTLYSQTTRSLEGWKQMVEHLRSRMQPGVEFNYFDTICRQVAGRVDHVREFAATHKLVLFVSGRKSSNGKVLYNQCLTVNNNTHLIESANEIDRCWFTPMPESIGICGATSTPMWIMEQVRKKCEEIISNG